MLERVTRVMGIESHVGQEHVKHIYFGCQPDEPLASLVITNRIFNVNSFLVFIMLLMYSVLRCLYFIGNKITTLWIMRNNLLSSFHWEKYALVCHASHSNRHYHFDEIFIIGCTGSCQIDNFQCSQWWKLRQNDEIFVWVL